MPFTEPAITWFEDGVTVTSQDGATTKGFLDTPEELYSLGSIKPQIVKGKYTLTFATAALPAIAEGQTITVAGTAYTICHIQAVDDGQISEADLEIQ